MTSESDKGGEGRGLPVGFAWSTYYGASSLAKGSAERVAEATATGAWCVYVGAKRIEGQVEGATATARFYGAQAAAEAALWARDGFGVGEVRGRFVAHGQGFGLPGDWRTKAVRAAPGGHDVDAVREGVEVDAVRAPVAADDNDPQAGGPALSLAQIRERYPEAWARARETTAREASALPVEPLPLDAPPAPAAGEELARLLRDLPYRIAYARQAAVDPEPLDAAILDLAAGAEALLAERERAADQNAALEHDIDEAHAALDGADVPVGVLDERAAAAAREIVALRARVAELEAERLYASGVEQRTVLALVDKVGTMEEQAKAQPPAVAGLLAAVEAEWETATLTAGEAKGGSARESHNIGRADGLRRAASLIAAHLGGAPSPLARVAAEAMALSPDDDSIYSPASMSDTYGKIRRLCEEDPEEGDEGIDDMVIARRDLARIARVALAGMLACDAAPADGAKGGA